MKMKHINKVLSLGIASLGFFGASVSSQAVVIYFDDFSGLAASPLSGTKPDTTVGTTAWTSGDMFGASGDHTSAGTTFGSATLPFIPQANMIYTLDISFLGITGDSNWFAGGFAVGQDAAGRFLTDAGTSLVGRAWALVRGSNSPNPNQSLLNGVGGVVNWTGINPSGGSVDLRIILDTTNATFTTTTLAKLAASPSYTTVTATRNLTNSTGLNSVGFAVSNSEAKIDGRVSSFTLSGVPEPSTALLGALGSLLLLRRRR